MSERHFDRNGEPCPHICEPAPEPGKEQVATRRIFGDCNAFCSWFVTGIHVEGCMALLKGPTPEPPARQSSKLTHASISEVIGEPPAPTRGEATRDLKKRIAKWPGAIREYAEIHDTPRERFIALLEAADLIQKAVDAALAEPTSSSASAPSEGHVCGMMGFGRGQDGINDECPACRPRPTPEPPAPTSPIERLAQILSAAGAVPVITMTGAEWREVLDSALSAAREREERLRRALCPRCGPDKLEGLPRFCAEHVR